jgi:hypothetical protein
MIGISKSNKKLYSKTGVEERFTNILRWLEEEFLIWQWKRCRVTFCLDYVPLRKQLLFLLFLFPKGYESPK